MALFGDSPDKQTDFSLVGTDFHSHLVPGIDDGASAAEETLAMAQKMAQLGFSHMITTPHINSDSFDNSEEEILEAYKAVMQELKTQEANISLEVAAEYFINFDFIEKLGHKKLLTFGRNYLLVEFSFYNAPINLDQLMFQIQTEGYNVVLAHPERYLYWGNDMDTFKKLIDRGVMLQCNIGAFAGLYGVQPKKTAEKLAQKGMIRFLGSDLHSPTQLNTIAQALDNKYLQQLLASGHIKNKDIKPFAQNG